MAVLQKDYIKYEIISKESEMKNIFLSAYSLRKNKLTIHLKNDLRF